jgi:hypothetical protein
MIEKQARNVSTATGLFILINSEKRMTKRIFRHNKQDKGGEDEENSITIRFVICTVRQILRSSNQGRQEVERNADLGEGIETHRQH